MEVSASGFTKEMEKDGALLHPAGPEGENADEEDSDDDEEAAEEEEEGDGEESLDMEEYRHAMQELEGLKVDDTHADVPDEAKQEDETEIETETRLESTAGGDEEAEKDLEDELREAEDECPELEDLSASNKEFKPFR